MFTQTCPHRPMNFLRLPLSHQSDVNLHNNIGQYQDSTQVVEKKRKQFQENDLLLEFHRPAKLNVSSARY